MPGPMRFASHHAGRCRPQAARPPAPEDVGAGDPSLLEALREAIVSAATPTLRHRLSVVLAEHLVTAVRPAEAFGAYAAVARTTRSPRRRRLCQAAMDFLLLPVDAVPEPGNAPAYASYLLRLGWALHYRARDELAAAYAGRAVDLGLAPEDLAVACLLLGLIGEARADWAGAVRHYARGCGTDAGEPRTRYFLRNNLAYSLLQRGECAAAEGYCREAIALAPGLHNAWKNLGLALRGQQHHAEAARAFLAAARIRPEDGRALAHLREMVSDMAASAEEGDDALRSGLEAVEALLNEAGLGEESRQ